MSIWLTLAAVAVLAANTLATLLVSFRDEIEAWQSVGAPARVAAGASPIVSAQFQLLPLGESPLGGRAVPLTQKHP
jgi:hypothetical protein